MANEVLCAVLFLVLAAESSHALLYSSPTAVNVTTRAQQPQANVVDFFGLTQRQATVIRNQLVEYLDRNVNNAQLTDYMWAYFRREDPDTLHLVTVAKCFDYCFEGTPPKQFITIDIDRGTNRFMMVGRQQC